MNRENRYIVIKHADADAVLTQQEQAALNRICTKVLTHRQKQGKEPLQCVVVEHDWPEYESTWHAIASRIDGTPGQTHDKAHSKDWPELSSDQLSALLRFCETCEDGQAYDVPKSMMKALAAIGVVQHMSAGIYSITEFGEAVIEKAGQSVPTFGDMESDQLSNTPIPHQEH